MSHDTRIRVSGQGLPGPPGADGSSTGSDISAETDDNVIPGTPVYTTIGSHFAVAQADGIPQADAVGLSSTSTLSGFVAVVQTQDILSLTTGQWDAVTGQVGGLTSGSMYWLDGANPGELTTTPPATPASTHDTFVGIALTSSKLDIKLRQSIQL